jgi:hypothetical protein
MMSGRRIATKGMAMSDGDVNRILSRRDEILPSSGFVNSVMEAVHQEASAPPPIPFPWKRAVPFVILGVAALALLVAVAVILVSHGSGGTGGRDVTVTPMLGVPWDGSIASGLRWTVLALVGAFVSVKLSMRLGGAS